MKPGPTQGQLAVALFTAAYIIAFSAWFVAAGNYEFIVYVITMVALVLLVGLTLRKAQYPLAALWALSAWGLLHMAGGGLPVDGSVLYNLRLISIVDTPGIFILKYDQLVHAYGFGVTAWVLHHLITLHFPETRGTATALVYPALASMGLGATNEIIEFSAVLLVPDTNVGGYMNTALDLCFNAIGAIVAVVILGAKGGKH